jgi:hypothetical protein
MNPGYSGRATNGNDTLAAAYHTATVSGPRSSLKIAQGVAFFGENGELNAQTVGCTSASPSLPLC